MLLSSCDTLTRSSSSFDPQTDLVDIGKVRKSVHECDRWPTTVQVCTVQQIRGWGAGHLIAYHTGCDKQMMHYHCCQYFCMCVCILWLWQTQRLFPAQTGWLTISLRVNHISPCIVVGSQASERPTTSPSPFMSRCHQLGWVHSRAVSVIKSGEPGLREEREREPVLSTPLMI